MENQFQKIPAGDTYLSSTADLSNAIDDWFSRTPDITIISINTIFNRNGQAAIITYQNMQETDQTDVTA